MWGSDTSDGSSGLPTEGQRTTPAARTSPDPASPVALSVPSLPPLAGVEFDRAPRELRRVVFGVPYIQLDDVTGGQLWVTRHGWKHLRHLEPSAWFFDRQYSRRGRQLSGGTGAVFCVPCEAPPSRAINLVVKFSRMAQEILLDASALRSDDLAQNTVEGAAVNDPFQEFGLLEELRNSRFGPSDQRILTKRPLAIYSPGRLFEPWQLGRTPDRFRCHRCRLDMDQATRPSGMAAVEMSIQRQYVMLFHWVRGQDAEQLLRQGAIAVQQVRSLVIDVVNDLAAKGFRVLDTKPNHIILRHRPGLGLLRRGTKPIYALVDFELLQRTEEYERWLQSVSRPDQDHWAGNLRPTLRHPSD
ncbi:MAG: hypothetical protein ACYC0X_15790 [Pirellulaceae bacterium]